MELNDIINSNEFKSDLTIFNPDFPYVSLELALSNKEKCTPLLLDNLEYAISNIEELDSEYIGHIVSLFALSELREVKAFPLILDIAKLTEEQQGNLLEESFIGAYQQFIGSTFNGDIISIQQIIEDKGINQQTRTSFLNSLLVLLNDKLIQKEQINVYVNHLFDLFHSHSDTAGVNMLINFCGDYQPNIFINNIEKSFETGLVDGAWHDLSFIKDLISSNNINEYKHGLDYDVITDAAWEIEMLSRFKEHELQNNFAAIFDNHDFFNNIKESDCDSSFINNEPKIGRNSPCPCGSGKKHKKCCISIH